MGTAMVERFHELGVKYLCCRSIGFDHVDRARAKELGMPVSNVDYPPNGVANYAIMLMMMSLRRVGHILKRGEAQDYSLKGKIGRDLSSCTVGVIGTGRIGRTVLKHLSGFGCKLLAYDLYPNDSGRAIGEYVDLDELYARADVISLHCNLTPENTGMINKDSIAKMKDGVILINNARGQLINEQDVADALNSGKMGAAGLDVVYTEPIRGDNPLLKAKNCIITPHISWAPKESRQRIMDCAVSNVKAFLAGSPVNVVN